MLIISARIMKIIDEKESQQKQGQKGTKEWREL